jgi:hypothetical protein
MVELILYLVLKSDVIKFILGFFSLTYLVKFISTYILYSKNQDESVTSLLKRKGRKLFWFAFVYGVLVLLVPTPKQVAIIWGGSKVFKVLESYKINEDSLSKILPKTY